MTARHDFAVHRDPEVGLDPFFFLYGHVQRNSFGVIQALAADLLVQDAQPFLRPDGVQHAFLAGGTTGCAELGWEDSRERIQLQRIPGLGRRGSGIILLCC